MKDKVSIPLEEQETHINYNYIEMGKMCEVYTTVPSMMKYLEKLVTEFPDECKLVNDDQYSYTVQIPFKLVKPRKPRVMTEEQRAAVAARLAGTRKREGCA